MNDAVYCRNERLHEWFNCEIELTSSTGQENLVEDIRTVVSSGTTDYDIAVGYQAFSIAVCRFRKAGNTLLSGRCSRTSIPVTLRQPV